MSECVIRAGESIESTDSRLSDTACVIETGVIIRPPPDLTLAVEEPPKVNHIVKRVTVAPPPPPPIVKVEEAKIEEIVKKQPANVTSHTAVPDKLPQVPKDETPVLNPVNVMIATGAVVAVAGTAAATSAVGGISTLQAKVASLFGTTKGAVATAAVVTAGTIVAVKALEKKMDGLERDLEKTKKEVDSASSSIDRIDELLDRLGS